MVNILLKNIWLPSPIYYSLPWVCLILAMPYLALGRGWLIIAGFLVVYGMAIIHQRLKWR